MKSKITKIQILKKGILLILMLAILLPSSIYAVEGLTLQESTTLEKLMYGEIGSVVKKIEEHFKSNTTLYIVNETQLRALAEYVNSGNSCQGKRIELLNDIKLNKDIDWMPIGNSYSEFSGTFYGNGYTISNLTYMNRENYETEGGYSNVGLFGVISKNGKVEKVNVNDSNITSNGLNSANINHVGNIAGTSYGIIKDCSANKMPLNKAQVNEGTSDNNYIGLLVGEKKAGTITTTTNQQPEVNFTVNSDTIKGDFKFYQKQGENFVEITDFVNTTYLKVNDTIRFEFTLDKYLYTGLEDGRTIKLANTVDDEGNVTEEIPKENYPMVSFAGVKATPIEVIQKEITLEDNTKKPQTKLVYEYTAIGEEEKESSSSNIAVNFTKNKDNENLYVYYSDDKVNFNTGDKIAQNVYISGVSIKLDSKVPSIKTEAYVEEALENNRYAEGKEIIITVTSLEQIQATKAPELKVSFSESGLGKYNYQTDSSKGNAVHVDAILDGEGKTTWIYSYIIQPGDEGNLNVQYISGTIKDLCENETDITTLEVYTSDIYSDTTAPTVEIIPVDVNNAITNKDTITYTFKFSEEVTDFKDEDITVNNGIKGILSDAIKDEEGKCIYTIDITPNVSNGNVGNLQVIIEKDAFQDLVGHGNIRAESTITVDKKAPILLSLEAYANNTDSSIKVDENIDTVKEYYKEGDTVTVVATFSENIENTTTVPTLALQFSESGNAKGTVSTGEKSGNKITYTYTITAEDMGTLSVKGFSGTVLDAAGNATIVTKRNLNGDTIIADTKAPTLVGITTIAPNFEYDELLQNEDTKRYGVQSKTRTQNTITIIAEYSENVYNLSSNTINKITDNTDSVLKLKFKTETTETTRTAKYYKTEGSKIYYTYNIASGDNGDLSIVSLSGTVSDIAGNTLTTDANTKLEKIEYYEESIAEENEVNNITADTKNSTFTITATAVNKDDNENEIIGNNNYYRKGSVITIKAETDEYVYKNNNNELTRFAENGSDAPQLNISFSTSGNGVENCTNVEYTNNQTIFTYTYTIKEKDNGTLNLNIEASKGYDIALNGNDAKTETISTIVSDTVRPYYADQPGIEYVNGRYKVTFNENLYYLSENNVVTSFGDINQAPLLKFEGQETEYTPSISNNVITYAGNYINAKPYLGASRLCDKAGNLYAYYDQEAPELLKIEVTSPETGTYKAGQEITIVATFSEKVTGIAPTLALQFSESGDAKGNVSNGVIAENTITYKYTITATDAVGNGDNGVLSIKSFTGTGLKDLSDNLWVAPTSVTLTGNKITADTIAPTLTITSDVERTNKDVVTYTFKWSELVTGFTAEGIEVTNGSKGAFKATDKDENGYATEYILEVDTTNEGRQIIKVNAGVCEDIAGNLNVERVTYNKVVIDYTKPVIRAKVNGGNYVLDNTDPENKKSTLKETIVVNEEVSKFEYIWSKSTTMPSSNFETINPDEIQINSDINLEKQVNETGTYYLYMKITDLAGNTFEGKTNGFIVSSAEIKLTPNTTVVTNKDVTVTVVYGEGLTENRKAGVSGLTQSADSNKVVIAENGTVYAEATDKAGNKVCKVLEIENIDKVAPEGTIKYVTSEDKSVTATISFNEENVTITNNNGESSYVFEENGEFTFEFEDEAGNKGTMLAIVDNIVPKDTTAPTIVFNYTLTTTTIGNSIGATITTDEDAIISYSWDNKTWTTSKEYIRSVNAINSPTEEGTYILYAKAEDEAGNRSEEVQTLEFTVIKAIEEVKEPEIIFEDLPTIQVDGVKYVKISAQMTTENLTSKMDKKALCEATPEYTKLTSDNKLKTGSEITINDETKYVIVVNGDTNCDGKVSPIDVTTANSIRLNKVKANIIQQLAADFDLDGVIKPIDITMINSYRLGKIKGI